MSLDTEKLHRLKGKGFPELYNTHPEKWQEMVHEARDYAQKCVGTGEKVRVGDIVTVVQNAIKIDPEFENHVKTRGIPQRYWILWFAEYIVEQVYPQPTLVAPANHHVTVGHHKEK